MAQKLSRRDLLKASAAVAVAPVIAHATHKQEKVRFGIIGVRGRGGSNLDSAAQYGSVVALCDVDATFRGEALAAHPDAATFEDFRQMLDAMHKQIDAVVVSTPDHMHAAAAAAAMRYGLHVYCEKPMTRTIAEARRLAQLAKDKKLATQMGNQGTSLPSLRQAAEHIRRGTFGAVKEVHCWTDRSGGWWPQGVDRPQPAPTPKNIDFNLWLGPSPDRPYAPGYHPFAWRGWWDFGSGALGDIGCHCMNLPFAALDLRDPIAVQAQTSGHNRDSFPSWSIVTYEFGQRGKRAPLKLFWYDGGKVPSQDIAPTLKYPPNGCLIVCEQAVLYAAAEYAGSVEIIGQGPMPAIDVDISPGHFAEWVRAIQGGKPAMSNFPNYAGPLTETVLLGNLAVWADGPRVEWDARKMAVKGTNEFDKLIRPPRRPGWDL